MKRYQLGVLLGLLMSMNVCAYDDDDDYYYEVKPRYYQNVPLVSGSITIPLGNTYNSPSITFSTPPVVYQPYYVPQPIVVYRRPYYRGYTSYRRHGEHRHYNGHRGHYNEYHH